MAMNVGFVGGAPTWDNSRWWPTGAGERASRVHAYPIMRAAHNGTRQLAEHGRWRPRRAPPRPNTTSVADLRPLEESSSTYHIGRLSCVVYPQGSSCEAVTLGWPALSVVACRFVGMKQQPPSEGGVGDAGPVSGGVVSEGVPGGG